MKMPKHAVSTAYSKSASFRMISGLFPPISKTTFTALGALDGDDSPNRRRTSEGDELHARIIEEYSGKRRAVAGNHVEHSGRYTGTFKNLRKLQSYKRRLFRRLQHKCISAGERERNFLQRKHNRKVEGRNPGDDT